MHRHEAKKRRVEENYKFINYVHILIDKTSSNNWVIDKRKMLHIQVGAMLQ